jgi:prepilin-type processing-associated H-X9-DG protein
LYAQDYHGYIENVVLDLHLATLFYPYLRGGSPPYPPSFSIPGPKLEVCICPSDPTMGGNTSYGAGVVPFGWPDLVEQDHLNKWGARYISYCENNHLCWDGTNWAKFKRNQVKNSALTIHYADYPWWTIASGVISVPNMYNPNNFTLWDAHFDKDRHRGMVNCLFLDGHVESLHYTTLVTNGSNDHLWQRDPGSEW